MKTKMTFSNTVAVRRWVLVAPALVAIVLASCTSQSGQDSPVIAALSSPAANALGAFLLIRPDLSPQDVAAVASPLTSVLYSASASQSLLESVSKSVTPEGSVFADVSDVPGLKVAYTRGNSTVLAFNERITRDTASLSDIGAAAAQSIFTSAFQSFLATGAISRTGLQIANAHASQLIQGEGRSGQAPTERVKEYAFRIPRTINGVEVFNAGFEASVHRSGQLARIKTFGPKVQSVVAADGSEAPTASGYTFVPSVTNAATDARIAADYPTAQVKPLGLRYWLPEGVISAVVEPREMYFVVPTATVEGHTVHARGFYVAYSMSNSGSVATVWPTPNPAATGDVRK
ncbi:MAG TPA: hypothetical protein VFG23_05340 [Polyangia bacterium]|nr:hypothetical protein [Polyangia bacterium]